MRNLPHDIDRPTAGERVFDHLSRHFVDHPTVEIESIIAMITLDMIGRLNLEQFTIYGVGSGREFRQLLDGAPVLARYLLSAESVAALAFASEALSSTYSSAIAHAGRPRKSDLATRRT